jgi:inosine/xanthosine triphosphatase
MVMTRCPSKAAITTRNPTKVRGATRALQYLCKIYEKSVTTIEPPGGLPKQPIGSLEVFGSALKRAVFAFRKLEGNGFGIGIEAGPIEFYTGTGYVETQVAVIVGPGELVSVGLSSSFELPRSYINSMKEGRELGALVPWRSSIGDLGESIGYIGWATSGIITRQDLAFQATLMALVPWYTGEISSLARLDELERVTNI